MAPDATGVPEPGTAVRPEPAALTTADFDPYIPRRVVPLGLHEADGWRLKLHGLSYLSAGDEAIIDPLARVGALRAAEDVLPRPAVGGGRYGVGFVIVHRAMNAYSYVVGWWSYNCLLSLAAYTARISDPADAARSPARQAGCVWELAVIDHERRAWTGSVMRTSPEPDLEAYLAAVLNTEV